MNAAANGQITQARLRFWRQSLDGPAREDIQSELAETDRYVHPTERIQKTGREFNFESFPLRLRCVV